jgi:RNA polymerase sigma factor (sigma-70 family)
MRRALPKRKRLHEHKNEDMDTFETIFRRYYDPLVRYLTEKMTFDKHISEDIVQSVMVKVWQNKMYLKIDQKQISYYLYTSVRNAFYDQVRQLTRERKRGQALLEISLPEEIPEQDYNAEETYFLENWERIIEGLPPQQRRVIALTILQKTTDQIVLELGMPIKVVRNRNALAIKKIREMLLSTEEISKRIFPTLGRPRNRKTAIISIGSVKARHQALRARQKEKKQLKLQMVG